MLPLANSSVLAPHFHFHAISYIPVPADIIVPVNRNWLDKPITLSIRAINVTHYVFSAGPSDDSVSIQELAYVGGDILSWGFTGALLGAYATSNGGNGSAPAYVTKWNYQGSGQVRDTWNVTLIDQMRN